MTTKFEAKVVKILDAMAHQELGDDANPVFIHTLELLLQDVQTLVIFRTILEEKDVRFLVNSKEPLTSKQMIDLAILLRQREEPVRLMVPLDSKDLTLEDLKQTKNLDRPNRSRRRRRNKKNNNSGNQNRKDN